MNREQKRQALKEFVRSKGHGPIDFEVARMAFNRGHYHAVDAFLKRLNPWSSDQVVTLEHAINENLETDPIPHAHQ